MIASPRSKNDPQTQETSTERLFNEITKALGEPEDLDSLDCESRKKALLKNAYFGDVSNVTKLLGYGVSIDTADDATGMTALHLAVGCNHLDLVRFLVENGASFVPDKQGRMPTTIAAECEVSEELCDFIVEAEAAAEARTGDV